MCGDGRYVISRIFFWIFPANLLRNQGDKGGNDFFGAINGNRRTILDTCNDRMCGSLVLNQNQVAQMKDVRQRVRTCTCTEGQALSGVKVWGTAGLNIVHIRQRGRLTKRLT
jgi:hypothetical protein